MADLLQQLRETSRARNLEWANGAEPDPLFQAVELGGEAGEALNEVKKLVREHCRRIAAGIQRYVIGAARPFIVPITHRGWGGDRCHDIDRPLPTVTTSRGGEFALVSAFMAQHNTGVVGHSMAAPVSTITARGTQQAIVTSHLEVMRDGAPGRDMAGPVPTLTTRNHMAEVRAFLVKYYGSDTHGQGVEEPLHTIPTRERFGLVTCQVDGVEYAIADIGMRMLTPRELFRAQGFPDSYEIAPLTDGKPMTKTASIARCGNSVCPPLAEALVRANIPAEQQERIAA